MQPATNDVIEVNLSAFLVLLCKLLRLCTKNSQLFRGIRVNFILWTHDTQFTIIAGSFCLVGELTIILNRRKLLQEYHITGRYTQLQCVAVNKRKRKYKK